MAPTFCADCCIKLGVFKRKHKCVLCSKDFCEGCFSKVRVNAATLSDKLTALGTSKGCLQCIVLSYRSIRRKHLFLLTSRELSSYLAARNICTDNCNEKYHLVDLIMDFALQQGTANPDDLDLEVMRDQSVEEMRQAAISLQVDEQHREKLAKNASGQSRVGDLPTDSATFAPNIGDDRRAASPERNIPWLQSDHLSEAQASRATASPKSMSNLKCVEDIFALSVLELKQILAANFVSYKDCLEKIELVDKVKMLYLSKREVERGTTGTTDAHSAEKGSSSDACERDVCKICMDRSIDCVFLECGHLVSCAMCGEGLSECPICHAHIVRIVQVFRV